MLRTKIEHCWPRSKAAPGAPGGYKAVEKGAYALTRGAGPG